MTVTIFVAWTTCLFTGTSEQMSLSLSATKQQLWRSMSQLRRWTVGLHEDAYSRTIAKTRETVVRLGET